jgi:hypothetical protein
MGFMPALHILAQYEACPETRIPFQQPVKISSGLFKLAGIDAKVGICNEIMLLCPSKALSTRADLDRRVSDYLRNRSQTTR